MYMFKLIDQKAADDIKEHNRIALSRPIVEFGHPEGELIRSIDKNITRDLKKKWDYFSPPDSENIHKISQWLCKFRLICKERSGKELSDDNLYTEISVLVCLYFQTYCGYFTVHDLDCPLKREQYIKDNDKFIKNSKKEYLLKLKCPCDESSSYTTWEYTNYNSEPTELLFSKNPNAERSNNNIVAFLRGQNMEYVDDGNILNNLLNDFYDVRTLSSWFTTSNKYYEKQKEYRLMLTLPGPSINDNRYTYAVPLPNTATTIEEKIYYYVSAILCNAIDSKKKNLRDDLPRFVYLQFKPSEYAIEPL